MATTLKTLVLKTATVTSVKLGAPADRIGLGRVVATYPADVQFPGQFSLPPRSGHRSPNSNAMRMHREEPATRSEREFPGSSARRWPASILESKRPASRGGFPAVSSPSARIGDCQSSDCHDDRMTAATRENASAAAAAK
ncbi:MAG: hypothetical protein U0791_15625 [Gemmataceae bacterium]